MDATPGHLPDPRDWEIIECLALDSDDIDQFADADVERVRGAAMVTDEQYKQLIADGHIPTDQLEAEKARSSQCTADIFEMGTKTIYQLSTGEKRKVDVTDCDLYEAFSDLVEDGASLFDGESFIVLQSEGYHRAVCINPDAVDYISIPSHLLEKSSDAASAEFIDELGDDITGTRQSLQSENPLRQTMTEQAKCYSPPLRNPQGTDRLRRRQG